jgi:arogenate dehydrogenase (NADP+)
MQTFSIVFIIIMNIGIAGLGLIGGSLGLDLRVLGHYVWGISRSSETCKQAVAIGAVDAACQEVSMIPYLAETEVVFVCTPIPTILPTIAAIAPQLAPQTIFTDVGSVKSAIVSEATQLCRFVGSHPMAGTAFSGINAAERSLFKNRPCVLTPTDDREAMAIVRSLWKSLGMLVYECNPEVHDRAVAWISHLPVAVSAALILSCQQEPDGEVLQLAKNLASSGFCDTSRVGGGNPELGRLMAEYNQTALLKTLHAYRDVLQSLIGDIENGNWDALQALLETTQAARPLYIK